METKAGLRRELRLVCVFGTAARISAFQITPHALPTSLSLSQPLLPFNLLFQALSSAFPLSPSQHLRHDADGSLHANPYRNTSFFRMYFRALFLKHFSFSFFLMIQELAAANDPIRCDSRVPNQNGEFGSADFGCRASVWDVRRDKKDWFDRSSG